MHVPHRRDAPGEVARQRPPGDMGVGVDQAGDDPAPVTSTSTVRGREREVGPRADRLDVAARAPRRRRWAAADPPLPSISVAPTSAMPSGGARGRPRRWRPREAPHGDRRTGKVNRMTRVEKGWWKVAWNGGRCKILGARRYTWGDDRPSCGLGGGTAPIAGSHGAHATASRTTASSATCGPPHWSVSTAAIDWCCLPRFDSGSVFAALLDPERGGTWAIRPRGEWTSTQRYLPRTNILETTFRTADRRRRAHRFHAGGRGRPPVRARIPRSIGRSAAPAGGCRCR